MFEYDLSVQHSSLYGTDRFSILVKETAWGKDNYSKYLSISNDGSFTGIGLSSGGVKPPRNSDRSPSGINMYTVSGPEAFKKINALEVEESLVPNVEVGGVE